MIITSANFVTSAVTPSQYPEAVLPEIAFAGRSNVGKSSLINTLINRKNLVKTSKTPGRTQLINFFLINEAISLVDLPGYGYAKVPQSVKKTWGNMIETYLLQRETLTGLVMIMDIRRSPGMEDLNFIDWLKQQRIPTILILTKIDKLSKNKQFNQIGRIAEILETSKNELLLFSAKTKTGADDLWKTIVSLIERQTEYHGQ